jgi:AcrR family transcriptional regulator
VAPRAEPVTRERVLAVAGGLFYRRGVRATGVADVIAAAGCGKQALYRLFPSKDHLVAAYLDEVAGERDRAAEEAARAAGPDPGARLVAVVAEVAGWAGRDGFHGCALRNYLHEHPGERSRAAAVAQRYLDRSRDRVYRLAEQVRPAGGAELARRVWLIHEGIYGGLNTGPDTLAAGVAWTSELVNG